MSFRPAILALAGVLPLLAAPVLVPYPQKVVTKYSLKDSAVPRSLLETPSASPSGLRILRTRDGAIWTGSDEGLVRYAESAPPADRWQYFAGQRYLCDDTVLHIVSDAGSGVWARTQTGVSHIELVPMTLEQKASRFEERIRLRHDRYGMVADSHLREPGNLASNQMVPNDNDGLWTAMYAAGECFRYSVTRSPEALANARKSIEAVLFLEQVTGRPGFPARSYIKRGDHRGGDGTWHWTAGGEIEWKADTSSDELVGHFFLFGIAYDLIPDAALKARIGATARRIMDHILEHGYYLTDIDGRPTTWGRWSPEYFSGKGRSDSPLNSLELLAFLRTTQHVTGDAKYDREYRKAAHDLGYLEIAAQVLERREEINYSDEELAMLPFYLVFRYEKDAANLVVFRRAIDQWWENIQREKNPLWTFIYALSRPAAKVDLEAAIWTLQRIPLDLVEWTVVNSHRRDIGWRAVWTGLGVRSRIL